jgi:RNA recognition motif-containing protein
MTKKIYVGNLPFSSTEEEIQDLFAQYGQVRDVNIIYDRETGRSRGFGFVEMDSQDALNAMETLNGDTFGGRTLKVSEARPRR